MDYTDQESAVEEVAPGEEAEAKPAPADVLLAFSRAENLATLLDKETLAKIGQECRKGYDYDLASRSEWDKQTMAAMELALQVTEDKTWPWPKAANVKYPLTIQAAIQSFGATSSTGIPASFSRAITPAVSERTSTTIGCRRSAYAR